MHRSGLKDGESLPAVVKHQKDNNLKTSKEIAKMYELDERYGRETTQSEADIFELR